MLRPDTPSCSVSRNTMFKIKKSCKHTHGSKSGQKPISSVRPEAYYQDFLKLYYNFFERTQLCKEAFKKLLFCTRNVPKVLNTVGGRALDLETAFFEFIRLHKCNNKKCDAFATRKCSACKTVRYCDRDCQERDFDLHSKLCPSLKQEKDRELFVGTIIQEEIKRRSKNDVKLISFESFLSLLFSKIFLLLSDLLNESLYPRTCALVRGEMKKRGLTDGHIDLEKLRNLRSGKIKSVDLLTLSIQIELEFEDEKENFLFEALGMVTEEDESRDQTLSSHSITSKNILKLCYLKMIWDILMLSLELLSCPCLLVWLLFLLRPEELAWVPGVDKFWTVTVLQMFFKSRSSRKLIVYVLTHYFVYFNIITYIWHRNIWLGWVSCFVYFFFTIILAI